MWISVLLFFLGILLGYRTKIAEQYIRKIDGIVSAFVFSLIFLVGVKIGANKDIVINLTIIGPQSLLLASSTIIGSIAAAKLYEKLILRQEGKIGGSPHDC